MQQDLQKLASQFFKIEKWHSARPLGKGHINDTYLIDFQADGNRQQWVLQILNTQIFKNPAAVEANWQAAADHLARSKYPLKIPALQPPINQQTNPPKFQNSKTPKLQTVRVTPFFENTFAPETAATPALAFEAARAYALFLRHLADFPVEQLQETIPDFHNSQKRWQTFQTTLKNDPAGRLKTCQAAVEKMLQTESIFLKINELKAAGELPTRPTHNDTKAGNVLLDSLTGQAVAVIDWDTIMPGTVLSDFGDMLRSFAPDRAEGDPQHENLSLRPKVVEAMCSGFLGETRHFLTKTEKENLLLGGFWIIAEQALRFLTDYLAGDVYYKISYPEQNLVRAENQLSLLREVQFFEKEIKRMLQ